MAREPPEERAMVWCPFGISVHVHGESKKGRIVGKVYTIRYYVGLLGNKREILPDKAPPLMTQVWSA